MQKISILLLLSFWVFNCQSSKPESDVMANPATPGTVLAQSAEESGWGTSRFAAEGNALFGQWAWGANAMKPETTT